MSMEKYECNVIKIEEGKLKVWIKKKVFNQKENKFIDTEEEEYKGDGKYITGPGISLKNFDNIKDSSEVDLKKTMNDFLSSCDFSLPLLPQLQLFLKNLNLLNIEENSLKERYLNVLNKTSDSLQEPSKIFKEFIYYLNSQSLNKNLDYLKPEIEANISEYFPRAEGRTLNEKIEKNKRKLLSDTWWTLILGGMTGLVIGLIGTLITGNFNLATVIWTGTFITSIPTLIYLWNILKFKALFSNEMKKIFKLTKDLERELNKIKETYYYIKLTVNLVEEFEKDLLQDLKLPINIYKIVSEVEHLIKRYKELIKELEKDFNDLVIVDLKKSLLESSDKDNYVWKIIKLSDDFYTLKEDYQTYTNEFNSFLETSKILVNKNKIDDSVSSYMEEYKSINNEINKEGISNQIKSKLQERLEKAKNDIKMTNFRNLLISWFIKKQEFENTEKKLELISLNEYQSEILEHLTGLQNTLKKMTMTNNNKLRQQVQESSQVIELSKNIF